MTNRNYMEKNRRKACTIGKKIVNLQAVYEKKAVSPYMGTV